MVSRGIAKILMDIDRWFRTRPAMAERAAMALMRRIVLPPDAPHWSAFATRTKLDWRAPHTPDGPLPIIEVTSRRLPPIPGKGRVLGKGVHRNFCPLCCQPTFAGGDWREVAGKPRWNKEWHVPCHWAYTTYRNYAWWAGYLARKQGGLCAITGERILQRGEFGDGYLGDVEVDHIVPLWRIALDADKYQWPDVLRFWGLSNLQALSRKGHAIKTAREAAERAALRRGLAGQQALAL
jgi:5-methylcytosine-specific restriction endonuclease McrA